MRFLLLVMIWGLASCAAYSPLVDYDRKASFAGISRYAFASAAAENDRSQSLDQVRIRRAVGEVLTAKGMTEVPLEQAQVWVDMGYDIDRRQDVRPNFYGYYGWSPYWWGMQPDYYLEERDESRLTLLIVDPASKQVIWSGQTVLRYYEEKPPQQRDASLKAQVDSILRHFPPR